MYDEPVDFEFVSDVSFENGSLKVKKRSLLAPPKWCVEIVEENDENIEED